MTAAKWWCAPAQEFQAACDAYLAEFGRRVVARQKSYADIFLNNVYADEVSGLTPSGHADSTNEYELRAMGIPPYFWPGYLFPQTIVFDDVPTLRPPAPTTPLVGTPTPASVVCPCGITRADCEYHRCP